MNYYFILLFVSLSLSVSFTNINHLTKIHLGENGNNIKPVFHHITNAFQTVKKETHKVVHSKITKTLLKKTGNLVTKGSFTINNGIDSDDIKRNNPNYKKFYLSNKSYGNHLKSRNTDKSFSSMDHIIVDNEGNFHYKKIKSSEIILLPNRDFEMKLINNTLKNNPIKNSFCMDYYQDFTDYDDITYIQLYSQEGVKNTKECILQLIHISPSDLIMSAHNNYLNISITPSLISQSAYRNIFNLTNYSCFTKAKVCGMFEEEELSIILIIISAIIHISIIILLCYIVFFNHEPLNKTNKKKLYKTESFLKYQKILFGSNAFKTIDEIGGN